MTAQIVDVLELIEIDEEQGTTCRPPSARCCADPVCKLLGRNDDDLNRPVRLSWLASFEQLRVTFADSADAVVSSASTMSEISRCSGGHELVPSRLPSASSRIGCFEMRRMDLQRVLPHVHDRTQCDTEAGKHDEQGQDRQCEYWQADDRGTGVEVETDGRRRRRVLFRTRHRSEASGSKSNRQCILSERLRPRSARECRSWRAINRTSPRTT